MLRFGSLRTKDFSPGKRWFESLSDEEKKLEATRMYDSVRAVLEGVKANNEELDARRIREKPFTTSATALLPLSWFDNTLGKKSWGQVYGPNPSTCPHG